MNNLDLFLSNIIYEYEFFYTFLYSFIFIALILFFLESRQVKKILDSNAESNIIHINTFVKKHFLAIRLIFYFFIIINLNMMPWYPLSIDYSLFAVFCVSWFLIFSLAFWDLCLKAVKNYQNIIFFILALIALFLRRDIDLIIAYLVVFAGFIAIYLVSKLYFKKEAIGVADIIFIPSLLAIVGPFFWSISVIVGCSIALIFALFYRIKYGVKLDSVPLIFYIVFGFSLVNLLFLIAFGIVLL